MRIKMIKNKTDLPTKSARGLSVGEMFCFGELTPESDIYIKLECTQKMKVLLMKEAACGVIFANLTKGSADCYKFNGVVGVFEPETRVTPIPESWVTFEVRF